MIYIMWEGKGTEGTGMRGKGRDRYVMVVERRNGQVKGIQSVG